MTSTGPGGHQHKPVVTACVCSAQQVPWPLAHTPVTIINLPLVHFLPCILFPETSDVIFLPPSEIFPVIEDTVKMYPFLVNRYISVTEFCNCLSLSSRFHDCCNFSNSNIVWIVIILLPFSGISYSPPHHLKMLKLITHLFLYNGADT